jgi:hypothetical protein
MRAYTRRTFLAAAAAPLASGAVPAARRFDVCLSPDAIEADPDLLRTVRRAGINCVWTTGFMYGHWHYTPERVRRTLERIRKAGMEARLVNVPLGHPGDSLGAVSGSVPLTPPAHWKPNIRSDGRIRWGTSLHAPATRENAAAVERLDSMGAKDLFVDDDFRLAEGPGAIGGCFCPEHMEEFRRRYSDRANLRDELIAAIRDRQFPGIVRDWDEFWCDKLTESFRAQQAAAKRTRLGIMVMYLGAEKAGIRLPDYSGVPFRVGELMFHDAAFAPVKGKTDELFSALFHRRFTSPELAYSETTAFPADQLSAANMAAKLAVSTIADVRNTMYMSGLAPFPRAHWDTLEGAMKKNAAIHQTLAGHTPRGPFHHLWGEASRYAGDDRPYSLFLASGVPFEVSGAPPADGWTFLSAADARAAESGALRPAGSTFVARTKSAGAIEVPESLPEIFRFKARIQRQLQDVPFVTGENPVVCAWYPSARSVLLWNLSETKESFALSLLGKIREVTVNALDVELVREVG